jgi:hypothetical protein
MWPSTSFDRANVDRSILGYKVTLEPVDCPCDWCHPAAP